MEALRTLARGALARRLATRRLARDAPSNIQCCCHRSLCPNSRVTRLGHNLLHDPVPERPHDVALNDGSSNGHTAS